MAFLFCQMIVLLAVLAVTATAFSSKMPFMKSTRSSVTSYSGRLALQMGSHGIYDVKSDNGVHSISFEVSNLSRDSIPKPNWHYLMQTVIPAVRSTFWKGCCSLMICLVIDCVFRMDLLFRFVSILIS